MRKRTNRVIIAGGRNFIPTNQATEWLIRRLEDLHPQYILTGDCRGADKWGCTVADSMLIKHKHFPADWSQGKRAGPMRNEEMAKDADACILFPGGTGTADMRVRAYKHGLLVYEYQESET